MYECKYVGIFACGIMASEHQFERVPHQKIELSAQKGQQIVMIFVL